MMPPISSSSPRISGTPAIQPYFGGKNDKILVKDLLQQLKEQDEAIKKLENSDILLKQHILEVKGVPTDSWDNSDDEQKLKQAMGVLPPNPNKAQLTKQLSVRAAFMKQLSERLESMTSYLQPGHNIDGAQAVPVTKHENVQSDNKDKVDDSDAIKDKELEDSVRAKWTKPDKRTRPKVVIDYGKHYFTRGPVVSDSLWSLGIGAVLAIGSPVMTVTIPTTLAMFAAYRLCTAFVRFCQNPKGTNITNMYEDWIKKDLEKARKKAAA